MFQPELSVMSAHSAFNEDTTGYYYIIVVGEGNVFIDFCQSFCSQGVGIPGLMSFLGVGIFGPRSLPGSGYVQGQ